MASGEVAKVKLPKKAKFLFESARYKVMYGGRGSGKSYSAAIALLVQGMESPQRVLCAREYQNSIKDSVHRLLSDQINKLGFDGFYEIGQTTIKGKNSTEFFFEGIKHNVNKIKSYEGISRCWVEEANLVTKNSWDILIPTIRGEGSEIWVTFNPELEDDETYQRFVVKPPPDAKVVQMNWMDNKWFPDVLKKEMELLKERDFVSYETVWLGRCRAVMEGAIYRDELEALKTTGRICKVPYDPMFPVDVFWDLGWSDFTSLWFAQVVRGEPHVIDCYQDNLKSILHYIDVLKERKYSYGALWLPHDAKKSELGTGKTVYDIIKNHGYRVEMVPNLSLIDGINATRMFLYKALFDEEKCSEGLSALRRYKYKTDPETGKLSREPEHNKYSHFSDSARYMSIALEKSYSGPRQHLNKYR